MHADMCLPHEMRKAELLPAAFRGVSSSVLLPFVESQNFSPRRELADSLQAILLIKIKFAREL